MLNFKETRSSIEVMMVLGLPAGSLLAGIEQVHMIRKGELTIDGAEAMSICSQFSALAGIVRPIQRGHLKTSASGSKWWLRSAAVHAYSEHRRPPVQRAAGC
jgi:hypothetical protein